MLRLKKGKNMNATKRRNTFGLNGIFWKRRKNFLNKLLNLKKGNRSRITQNHFPVSPITSKEEEKTVTLLRVLSIQFNLTKIT